jgi:hypothetical protein
MAGCGAADRLHLLDLCRAERLGEVGLHSNQFYGVDYPTLGVPLWLPQLLTKVMWIALATTIAMLIWRLLDRGQRVPLIVLLPAFTQYVWFVATPAGQFGYMVPFFHSLQYLLIAWSVQMKVGLAERKRDPSVGYVWSSALDGDQHRRWRRPVLAAPHIGSLFGKSLAFSTAVMLARYRSITSSWMGIWRLRTRRLGRRCRRRCKSVAAHEITTANTSSHRAGRSRLPRR